MFEYKRKEIEEMMQRWLKANQNAVKEGNWKKFLGAMYTEDAIYSWNVGPYEEFIAHGRKEIEDIALGYQMKGFENWNYPYDDIIIDDKKGEIVCFWRQVAPVLRDDGSTYEVAGIGGSWFTYAGGYKWSKQKDFFDFSNVKTLLFELAGDGKLDSSVKQKIHIQSKGGLLPGHVLIRQKPGLRKKILNFIAIIKISISGK